MGRNGIGWGLMRWNGMGRDEMGGDAMGWYKPTRVRQEERSLEVYLKCLRTSQEILRQLEYITNVRTIIIANNETMEDGAVQE